MLLTHRRSISKFCIFSGITILLIYFSRHQTPASLHSMLDDVSSAVTTHLTITPKSSIPQILWYKLGPAGLNPSTRAWTQSCINQSTPYTVNFLTDDTSDEYVKSNFPMWMKLLDTYLDLKIPILKADLLRYLLLYQDGGIWNDLDVFCGSTPIAEWIPEEFRKEAALVVGLEFDVGIDLGWSKTFVRQFATWTMMAKPKSPHLLYVIEDILQAIDEKARDNEVPISELRFNMIGDVVDLTGPRRFTNGIYKSLSTMLNETIDQGNVTHVMEPKMIGDVLVLPGYSFASGSNRYEKNFTVPLPLVVHHYAGSWKNDHGGELVPKKVSKKPNIHSKGSN